MYSGLNEEDSQCSYLVPRMAARQQFSVANPVVSINSYRNQEAADVNLALQVTSTSTMVEKPLTTCTVAAQRTAQPIHSSMVAREIEDEEVLRVETVSMYAVKIKQANKKIRSFFFNTFVLLVSILVIGMLTVLMVTVPELIYKIEVLIIALVVSSYLLSAEMKCIYRAQRQRYLTADQIVPMMRKKVTSASSEDMKHFAFVTQDTETYLRALTAKELNGGFRS
jgi:hypothetical protein